MPANHAPTIKPGGVPNSIPPGALSRTFLKQTNPSHNSSFSAYASHVAFTFRPFCSIVGNRLDRDPVTARSAGRIRTRHRERRAEVDECADGPTEVSLRRRSTMAADVRHFDPRLLLLRRRRRLPFHRVHPQSDGYGPTQWAGRQRTWTRRSRWLTACADEENANDVINKIKIKNNFISDGSIRRSDDLIDGPYWQDADKD